MSMQMQYGRDWLRDMLLELETETRPLNILETETKTRPLNIAVQHHSDSYAFSITPKAVPLLPFGTLVAIRVQDLETFEWFNWDGFAWDKAPEVHVGPGRLYIAAGAINEAGVGFMQMIIRDDVGNFLAVKQETVPAGGDLGVETGTIEMPDRQYGINILVDP